MQARVPLALLTALVRRLADTYNRNQLISHWAIGRFFPKAALLLSIAGAFMYIKPQNKTVPPPPVPSKTKLSRQNLKRSHFVRKNVRNDRELVADLGRTSKSKLTKRTKKKAVKKEPPPSIPFDLVYSDKDFLRNGSWQLACKPLKPKDTVQIKRRCSKGLRMLQSLLDRPKKTVKRKKVNKA